MPNPASIFSFMDYREYVKCVFEHMKATKPQFSYRYFARLAGFGGQSYLRMIMDGERNLSFTGVGKFAKAFKLDKKETAYFESLVSYNQAKSEEQKEFHHDKLVALRPRGKTHGMSPEQFECFTHSHFVAIREMAALPEFREDPEWIAAHLNPRIAAAEARHALAILEKLGLLTRDADGKLKHSETTLETPVDTASPEILNYHRKILAEAKDVFFNANEGEFDVSSLAIPLQKKAFPRVMELIQKCLSDIAHVVNESGADFHEVYRVNFQMYPATTVKAKAKAKKP